MRFLILLFLVYYTQLFSNEFKGKVLDINDNSPVVSATVRLEATPFGSYTNSEGIFKIEGIDNGKYRVIISSVGFKTVTKNIKLPDSNNINIYLEERSLKTGEVVVSANKRVQAVQEVPISMSVISNENVLKRGITRLDDALEYVPGVEVNQDNVSIRGSSGFAFGIGSRVALLVDGFPLLAGDNGDMKFDALPMFNTDQIEIVKGAGSALYGTSALGGVVNLITKKPTEKADIRARLQGGIYTKPRYEEWEYSDDLNNLKSFDLAYSQKFGDFGFSITGGLVDDQSYRAYDDSFRWNTFAKLDYNLSESSKINLNFNATQEDKADWVYWNSLDSATIPPTTTDRDIRIRSDKYAAFGMFDHIFSNNNFINVKSGIYFTKYSNSFEANSAQYRQSEAVSLNTEIQMNTRLNSNALLTYGFNFMNNNVSSKTYGARNQQIISGYAQGEYSGIQNATLTLGTRIDYERTGDLENDPVVSPKLGFSYRLTEDLNLRASAGAGFRAPSIAERFSSVSFQGFEVIPNPELKAEKSWSFETGFNYETEIFSMPFSVDISVFDNEMFDLIEPQFLANQGAVIKFDNVTRARIFGGEVGIRTLLFGFLGFETSLTAMNPRDLDLNETLKYRSEILWYNSIYIPFGGFELSADYRFKSETQNVDERLGIQVVDYDARVPVHIVDARLFYNFENNNLPIKIGLLVNNLFDYYYTEMVGNLGLTRRINLQLELDL